MTLWDGPAVQAARERVVGIERREDPRVVADFVQLAGERLDVASDPPWYVHEYGDSSAIRTICTLSSPRPGSPGAREIAERRPAIIARVTPRQFVKYTRSSRSTRRGGGSRASSAS